MCVIRVYKICHLEYPHRYVDVCYETLQLPPPPTNSSILVLLSVLYVRQVTLCSSSWGTEGSSFKPGYMLFILVTMEILISCFFLIVFIG